MYVYVLSFKYCDWRINVIYFAHPTFRAQSVVVKRYELDDSTEHLQCHITKPIPVLMLIFSARAPSEFRPCRNEPDSDTDVKMSGVGMHQPESSKNARTPTHTSWQVFRGSSHRWHSKGTPCERTDSGHDPTFVLELAQMSN